MPEGAVVPERYQQAEWIVRFVTDAVNHGRRDEMADCFLKSNVSAAFGQVARDCPLHKSNVSAAFGHSGRRLPTAPCKVVWWKCVPGSILCLGVFCAWEYSVPACRPAGSACQAVVEGML